MESNHPSSPASEEELKREIEKLKGEISAACLAISHLYGIFRVLDGISNDTMFPQMVSKFMEREVSADSIRSMKEDGVDPDDFIEGVNRFKERFSNHLSKLLSHYSTD